MFQRKVKRLRVHFPAEVLSADAEFKLYAHLPSQ